MRIGDLVKYKLNGLGLGIVTKHGQAGVWVEWFLLPEDSPAVFTGNGYYLNSELEAYDEV